MSRVDPIRLAEELVPPGPLREFSRRFASQADCQAFLFAVRYPTGFVCPRCAVARGWPLRGHRLIECANGHKVSLTAGTVLHSTRQDLLTWFHAAFLISTFTPLACPRCSSSGSSACAATRPHSRCCTGFAPCSWCRVARVCMARSRSMRRSLVGKTVIGTGAAATR